MSILHRRNFWILTKDCVRLLKNMEDLGKYQFVYSFIKLLFIFHSSYNCRYHFNFINLKLFISFLLFYSLPDFIPILFLSFFFVFFCCNVWSNRKRSVKKEGFCNKILLKSVDRMVVFDLLFFSFCCFHITFKVLL